AVLDGEIALSRRMTTQEDRLRCVLYADTAGATTPTGVGQGGDLGKRATGVEADSQPSATADQGAIVEHGVVGKGQHGHSVTRARARNPLTRTGAGGLKGDGLPQGSRRRRFGPGPHRRATKESTVVSRRPLDGTGAAPPPRRTGRVAD